MCVCVIMSDRKIDSCQTIPSRAETLTKRARAELYLIRL